MGALGSEGDGVVRSAPRTPKVEVNIPFFFFSTPRVLVLVVALALDLGMALVAFDLESAVALEAFGGILNRWQRRQARCKGKRWMQMRV